LQNDAYVAQQELAGFQMVTPFHWGIGDAGGNAKVTE